MGVAVLVAALLHFVTHLAVLELIVKPMGDEELQNAQESKRIKTRSIKAWSLWHISFLFRFLRDSSIFC